MSAGELLASLASIAVILDFGLVHGPKLVGLINGNTMPNSKPKYPRLYGISVNVLLILALVLSGLSLYLWRYNETDVTRFPVNKPLQKIYAKTFTSEEIEVDGKEFDHCTFENVTFIYHGLSAWSFENATFKGNTFAETDNMAAKGFTTLTTWIQHQPGVTAIGVGDKDQNGNVNTQSFDVIKPENK